MIGHRTARARDADADADKIPFLKGLIADLLTGNEAGLHFGDLEALVRVGEFVRRAVGPDEDLDVVEAHELARIPARQATNLTRHVRIEGRLALGPVAAGDDVAAALVDADVLAALLLDDDDRLHLVGVACRGHDGELDDRGTCVAPEGGPDGTRGRVLKRERAGGLGGRFRLGFTSDRGGEHGSRGKGQAEQQRENQGRYPPADPWPRAGRRAAETPAPAPNPPADARQGGAVPNRRRSGGRARAGPGGAEGYLAPHSIPLDRYVQILAEPGPPRHKSEANSARKTFEAVFVLMGPVAPVRVTWPGQRESSPDRLISWPTAVTGSPGASRALRRLPPSIHGAYFSPNAWIETARERRLVWFRAKQTYQGKLKADRGESRATLITGGAGYIGSYAVLAFGTAPFQTFVGPLKMPASSSSMKTKRGPGFD